MTFTGCRDEMREKAVCSRIARGRSGLARGRAGHEGRCVGMPAAALSAVSRAAAVERQQGGGMTAVTEYIKMNRQTGADSQSAATPF